MRETHDLRGYWERRARLSTFRWNLATWLDFFLPALFVCAAAFATALLLARKMEVNTRPVWTTFAAFLLVIAGVGLFHARSKLFRSSDAFARLDIALGLHNRLTAANAGIARWPEKLASAPDGLHWRWQKIILPLGGSALLIWAAATVPFLSAKTDSHSAHEQPLAWSQVESWHDTLQKEKLVEEQALEKLRNQLDELRQQPADSWYSHSSLEAGDNLRQETERSLRALEHDLQAAAEAVALAQKFGEGVSSSELRSMDEAWKKALQGLQTGNLPLNKELLAQLKNFDPSKLKQLTAEQMAELQKRLKEGTGICKTCLGGSGEKPGGEVAILTDATKPGGLGGGGGPAPLTVKNEPTQLGSKGSGSITNDDLTRAMPGEVLGLSKGEHEVQKTASNGPTSGGAIQSAGQGGETVWKDEFTPDERETLQRYFK